MSDPARRPMTADEFIAWAMDRPAGERAELFEGQVVAMAPERLGHVRAKQAAFLALREAVRCAGLQCETLIDGPVVSAGSLSAFRPVALVRCGPPLPDDTVLVSDPVVVVEVVSQLKRGLDTTLKLGEYFRIPTLRHYLVALADTRRAAHHARLGDGSIASRILGDGPFSLDPPGIEVGGLFD